MNIDQVGRSKVRNAEGQGCVDVIGSPLLEWGARIKVRLRAVLAIDGIRD
jgi:hypothetical protein